MGSSKIQWLLIYLIFKYLISRLKDEKYVIATNEKVMVTEKGTRWFITDWDDPIEIINGITLNIKELLEKGGIKI